MMMGYGEFAIGPSRSDMYGCFLHLVAFWILVFLAVKLFPVLWEHHFGPVFLGLFVVILISFFVSRQKPMSSKLEEDLDSFNIFALTNQRLLACGDSNVRTLCSRKEVQRLLAESEKVTVFFQGRQLTIRQDKNLLEDINKDVLS